MDAMTKALDVLAVGDSGGVPLYGLLVDGRAVTGSGPTIELVSRLDRGSLGAVASASGAEISDAYRAAAAAQPAWAARPPAQRAEVLQRAAVLFRERAGGLGDVISAEMGKPFGEARAEVDKGAAVLEYYAQLGYRPLGDTYVTDTGDDVLTYDEPLGVVTLITPWNFPFTLPLRKIAASLATGNAALFKPASNATLCGLAIGQTMLDAGLPPGVLNVVVGEAAIIEHALFTDDRLGGVSLTGSYATAAAIRKLLPVEVPYQAELGGKNALVVWADANLDEALAVIAASSFRNNGQICTSSGRVLAHAEIADALLDRLRAFVLSRETVTPEGQLGILSSDRERDKILATLERTSGQAAETIAPPWDDDRFPPTVLVHPEHGELTQEEIFGPVITFEVVTDIDDAIAKANATRYGLTAGIVTSDLTIAQRFWRGSTAGTVKVNAPLTGTPFHVPLEGWGRSGAGAGEGGAASLHFFTRRKAVHIKRP